MAASAKREQEAGGKAMNTLTPWDKVKLAREIERPNGMYYIEHIFNGFVELHGDRHYGDDPAIVGGIAYFNDQPVTVIAHQKGMNTKENIARNFGMPHPEGYRKSMRLMKQAEKFGRPVICFIDTPGAYCGLGAEERGEGESIAQSLMLMSRLKTPVIAIVIGEGGSGGALALGVADRVYMLENAVYSILSPEGFASILWKDAKRAEEAASVMKVTAQELKRLKVIDGIIPEASCGVQNAPEITVNAIRHQLERDLVELGQYRPEELIEYRYHRYRKL